MPHNKHPAGSRERRRSSSPDDAVGQMHNLKGGSTSESRKGNPASEPTDVADTIAWRDRKHSGEVFIVYTNLGKIDEWRTRPDPSTVLDVVQSTDIFHEGSSNGEPGRASKAILHERFGTDDRNEVLMRILQEGEIRHGQRAHEHKFHRGAFKEQTGGGGVH